MTPSLAVCTFTACIAATIAQYFPGPGMPAPMVAGPGAYGPMMGSMNGMESGQAFVPGYPPDPFSFQIPNQAVPPASYAPYPPNYNPYVWRKGPPSYPPYCQPYPTGMGMGPLSGLLGAGGAGGVGAAGVPSSMTRQTNENVNENANTNVNINGASFRRSLSRPGKE